MLMTNRIVSKMAITRSWKGFSLPMTTPNDMRTLAAASPPSNTLEIYSGHIKHLSLSQWYLIKFISIIYSPGWSLVKPIRRIANSVTIAVMMMVKLMALYPYLWRKVIRNPNPANSITWMSIITGRENDECETSSKLNKSWHTWILVQNCLKIVIFYPIWSVRRVCRFVIPLGGNFDIFF